MKFINVRGCNGSGKTTLLRMMARDPLCVVHSYNVAHTYKGQEAYHPPIPVTFCPGGVAILGDYTPGAGGVTAGCDRIKTQEAIKQVLDQLALENEVKVILFEGVLVSTIYGPWKEWAAQHGGMVWAFLDTPLEVCLERIYKRNGGKPIKENQVGDKHRTISRLRAKALKDGLQVADIRWDAAWLDFKTLVKETAA